MLTFILFRRCLADKTNISVSSHHILNHDYSQQGILIQNQHIEIIGRKKYNKYGIGNAKKYKITKGNT